MSRTRPLPIPAARVHRAAVTACPLTVGQSEQINGPLQPMEGQNRGGSLVYVVGFVLLVVAVFGIIAAGWHL